MSRVPLAFFVTLNDAITTVIRSFVLMHAPWMMLPRNWKPSDYMRFHHFSFSIFIPNTTRLRIHAWTVWDRTCRDDSDAHCIQTRTRRGRCLRETSRSLLCIANDGSAIRRKNHGHCSFGQLSRLPFPTPLFFHIPFFKLKALRGCGGLV